MNPSTSDPENSRDTQYEDFNNKIFLFNDASLRRSFIRRVYSILMLMLLVTFVFVGVFTFHTGAKMFARKNYILLIVCAVLSIVLIIVMVCCVSVRRKTPMNFCFLGAFTLCESVMMAYAAAALDSMTVCIAVGITAGICLSLTIFAFQTKYDFTGFGPYLFVCLLVLMIFGIFTIFFSSQILELVYGGIGVLVFSLYLVYDTQVMIGGNHKYAISPEEYIFAALQLYLDILNILLYVMRFVNAIKG